MLLSLDLPKLRAFLAHRSRLVILLVGTMANLCGQTSIFRQFNPISTSSQGVHLYGISVFSGYYSGGLPYGTGVAVNIAPSANPSYDVAVGSVATFGWNRSGERSGISVTYSPSFFGSIRRSESNTLNHSFSLAWNRKLTSKWSVGASAAGATANFEQMLFAPTTFSTITSM